MTCGDRGRAGVTVTGDVRRQGTCATGADVRRQGNMTAGEAGGCLIENNERQYTKGVRSVPTPRFSHSLLESVSNQVTGD